MNKKIFFWGAAVAAFGLLVKKTSGFTNFYNRLTVLPRLTGTPSFRGGIMGYLEVPFSIEFQNRSNQAISLRIPSIKAMYRNTEFGDIKPNDRVITIDPYKSSTFANLKFQFSYQKLLGSGVAQGLVTSIVSGNLAAIYSMLDSMKLIITVSINGSDISYEEVFRKADVSGLGLVSTASRTIKPRSDYMHLIAPLGTLEKTDPVVNPDGNVDQTVALMKQIVVSTPKDTARLAKTLKGKNLEETLHNIFSFVYTYIQYELDSPLFEQLRRPLRTLYDQKGDCDCYSILIGSILYNLDIPFKFRVTAYQNRPNFQHVYVIVPRADGSYYTIDPVLENFNEEKPFTRKKDFSL